MVLSVLVPQVGSNAGFGMVVAVGTADRIGVGMAVGMGVTVGVAALLHAAMRSRNANT